MTTSVNSLQTEKNITTPTNHDDWELIFEELKALVAPWKRQRPNQATSITIIDFSGTSTNDDI